VRRQIVMGLIACMLSSGTTVWAQDVYVFDEAKFNAESYALMREHCLKNKDAPGVEGWCVRNGYLPAPTTKWLSPGLAVAGLLTTIAGMGVAMHWGEDTKNVLGNQYCVSDYGDVEYGSCGGPTQTQIGLIMIGSGVLMGFIGSRHVAINPQISKDKKAVTATVEWGSDRRR